MQLEAYKLLKDYDLHYSTVRSAISTFLLGITIALGQFALRFPSDFNFKFALLLTIFLFSSTLLITSYFQALTWSCRKLQQAIEDQIYGREVPTKVRPWSGLCQAQRERILSQPMDVRNNIEEVFRQSDFFSSLWSDKPLQYTIIGIVIYLILFVHYGRALVG